MTHFRFRLLFAFSMLCLFARAAAADNVIVALHESPSTVPDQTVRVGDIASVLGGTSWDRRNVEQLDLESLRNGQECSITRKQVEMRLLLAGYKRSAFQVTGPTVVSAKLTTPSQVRQLLEKKLLAELSRQYAVRPDRVSVRLTDASLLRSLEKDLPAQDFSLELLPRNEFPIGRTRLRADLVEASGSRRSLTFDAEISLAMKVALASQPIPRGTVIKPGMFRLVDRAVTQSADFIDPETVVGRTTSRYISNNSILLASHLASARATQRASIRRNSLLDIVVKIGGSEVRLKDARAMEPGTVGDTIEVINPQTNRRINALIIGPNLATVSTYPRRF